MPRRNSITIHCLCFFFQFLRIIYSVIALSMFGLAIIVQIPKLNVTLNGKMAVLLAWAAYGVIPLGHWTAKMGGLENELVRVSGKGCFVSL